MAEAKSPDPNPPATAIRRAPPALLKWLFEHMLGGVGGEALVSPLTYTHGIFEKPPMVHGQTIEHTSDHRWGWAIDNVASAEWRHVPWPHNVLITVEETDESVLDALVKKAWCTAAAGRGVFMLLATARKWEALKETNATSMLYIPTGGVPWGDAVGWPDVAGATDREGRPRPRV